MDNKEEMYLICDDTEYAILLPENFCKLSDEHKKKFFEVIGCTPEEQERYQTTIKENPQLLCEILSEIKKKFFC